MTDKEQIIIDGKKYNKCNGCKLWDGYICTGDRSYEPNAEAHRAICNEHIAKEFWKVYHELFCKTQECEELKSQIDADYEDYSQELKTLRDIISNKEKRNAALFLEVGRYHKALEEIEEYIYNNTDFDISDAIQNKTAGYDILQIIKGV